MTHDAFLYDSKYVLQAARAALMKMSPRATVRPEPSVESCRSWKGVGERWGKVVKSWADREAAEGAKGQESAGQ